MRVQRGSRWIDAWSALVLLLAAVPVRAQQPADASELAKQTQNPVANLITLPLQFNFNGAGDLGQETFFNLNVQPVMPFTLSADYNVIARTIIPINSAPGPNGTRYSGVGDIQAQLFITPADAGDFVLGAGPVFSLRRQRPPPSRPARSAPASPRSPSRRRKYSCWARS